MRNPLPSIEAGFTILTSLAVAIPLMRRIRDAVERVAARFRRRPNGAACA